MSIDAENSQKTSAYLKFNYFQVSRCVGAPCVHERMTQIITVQAQYGTLSSAGNVLNEMLILLAYLLHVN